MPLPAWPVVRAALTAAIREALPLQVAKADGQRIAGIGLHMDAYYGSAGLYLLPEAALHTLAPKVVNNIGDWPISTDWDPAEDHSQAFARHWEEWDQLFHDHLDELTDAEMDQKFRALLQVACEAMQEVEAAGLLAALPRTEDFRIIVCEHDEPEELGLERYGLFVRTGQIRCHGDDEE